MPWWTATSRGLTVHVRVTPNSRQSEIVRTDDDRLWVRVAAPAVEGQANDDLRKTIAHAFHVRVSTVTIRRGLRSRDKQVLISGLDEPPELRRRGS
jgi:uncharacterized protein (TIGR00251 family)